MNLEQFDSWVKDTDLWVEYGRKGGVYAYHVHCAGQTPQEVFRDKNPAVVKVFIKGWRARMEIKG